MRDKSWRLGTLILLVVLVSCVFIMDEFMLPGFLVPAAPYAISILFAAYFLPIRYVVAITAYSLALQIIGLTTGEATSLDLVMEPLGLVVIGILGITLSARTRREAFLKEQAEKVLKDKEQVVNTLRSLIDAMPAGVLVSDASGEVVLANAMANDIIGRPLVGTCPRSEPLGLLFLADGSPLTGEQLPLFRAITERQTVRDVEIFSRSASGAERVTIAAGSPVVDDRGNTTGAVAVFQDVTERKKAERLQEEYTSLISHDLRAPLTVMIGQAELLRRKAARLGIQDLEGSISAIVASGKKMNSMIQELVDSARLESGTIEMHKEPIQICYLLADTVQSTIPPEQVARIRAAPCRDVPPVYADSDRLERALANLLTNALKYSPGGSPVEVRVELNGGEVIVSVSDHGLGIPPEDLCHIFSRFYRAKASRSAEGLGLGLYITRMIAESHGGRIWAESEVGKGSTFHLALPAAED